MNKSMVITEMSKILLVDDDRMNHMILSAHLKSMGFREIITAFNGKEALKQLETNQFCKLEFASLYLFYFQIVYLWT
jgi:CheY-like chemotaxis protein